MKVLGLMIANGFSSEVSAGSRMVGSVPGVEPLFFVHSSGNLDPAKGVERNLGASVITVDAGWRPNPDGLRPNWAKVASWAKLSMVLPGIIAAARRFQPDFIYSSQQKWDCTAASAVALALRKPQVVHLHFKTGPWLGALPLARLRACERVIAVSDFTRNQVIEIGRARPERVRTVLNSMPPFAAAEDAARAAIRAELGIAPNERVAGLIARFDESKGQRESIDAFARLASDLPNSRLVLVGAGLTRAALVAHAASLGLSERVIFTGNRGDVPALLSAFDVFLHPSYADPCPLAVLEGQAAGLPIVAFADGGVPEIVENEETGLLSPTGDVAALAANLRRALVDVELSARLGAAGAARVRDRFQPSQAGLSFMEAVRDLKST